MSDSQYLEPNEAALENVEHIIVLMLENRSLDNLLGWLYDDQAPPRGPRCGRKRRGTSGS